MAGFKETPRQKMIGMMYLVLTALLALNVSKEILDAFVIVNDSIEKTSSNFSGKVDMLHSDFAAQYSLDKQKVGPHYQKSVLAKDLSSDLIHFIDSLKYEIIARTENIPVDTAKIRTLAELKKKDDFDTPTNMLVGAEGYGKRAGWDLQQKIEKYRADMLLLIPEEERETFTIGLETDGVYKDADGKSLTWIQHNFDLTILAADVVIFNKLINEVKNSEYDVVSYLFQGISKNDFKFTDITAKILPTSVFVFQGDPFEAEIIVAAVDESSHPLVDYKMGVDKWDDDFLNSSQHIVGDSGFVKLVIPTANKEPKLYSLAGRIGIQKPNNGGIEYHEFNSSFFVAEPSANVAATKMNVFYRGVDNPIKISAAGVPATELQYSIKGDGSIVKTKDGLAVKGLTKKKVQNVTVYVFSGNGADRKELGKQEFRVKDLPDPNVFVRGMTGKDRVAKQSFLVNPYLLCALPEYINFEFKFKVVSFNMVINKGGDTFIKHSSSAQLSAEMKDYIKNARKNSMIVFTDIKVQGPIRRRDVAPFVIKLN